MADLFHYTCSHSAPGIRTTGALRPHPQIQLDGTPMVWLTDMEFPDRFALGLTSYQLSCDRTEHRVAVATDAAVRWHAYARRLPRAVRDVVEAAPGVLPMHWWVALAPVPILAIDATAGLAVAR